MAERRRAKRQSISYYIQVMDSTSNRVIGNLADVSKVGIMIDGRQPLPLNEEVRVRMDTTPEVANVLHIDFIARVRWCKVDDSAPGIYDIGLELVSISSFNAGVLAKIAEKYGTQESSFNF
jgi:PilZ domain